jgi:hypothetical protein
MGISTSLRHFPKEREIGFISLYYSPGYISLLSASAQTSSKQNSSLSINSRQQKDKPLTGDLNRQFSLRSSLHAPILPLNDNPEGIECQ